MTSFIESIWNFLASPIILNKIEDDSVLRTQYEKSQLTPINITDLSVKLNKSILRIYGRFLSEDGHKVDYQGIKKSDEFSSFLVEVQKLNEIDDLGILSIEETKCFFLNLYNCLVIHGYIKNGIPEGFRRRLLFYQETSYQIGQHTFSLDDIEHGILRGNRKHPAFFKSSPFKQNDPRLAFSLKEFDSRIHFTLVCGAKSCPPIRFYTLENLERGLDIAAQVFCNDDNNLQIDLEQNTVHLSQLFEWYQSDFGKSTQELLEFISKFLHEVKQRDLLALLNSKEPIYIVYLKYDWSLNN